MQRLLRLAQHNQRPPFPSSFFSGSRGSISGQSSYRSQNFSDSSRSRPPSSKTGSAGSGSGPAKASRSKGKNSVSSKASSTTATLNSEQDAAKCASDTAAESSETSKTSARPLEVPRSIVPVPILSAHPTQIRLDSFFSLDRPLLNATVSLDKRQYPSEADKKFMEIVGEPTEKPDDMHGFAFLEAGEYDSYLITEPDGANSAWSDGVDRFLATLDHTVPPPVSTSHLIWSAASTSSKAPASATPQSTNKAAIRRNHIDYLFPIQAEEKRASEDTKKLFSNFTVRPLFSSSELHKQDRSPTRTLASRFVVDQASKNQWQSLWEWEKVYRALSAATADKSKKGKAKSVAASDEGLQKPLESLRQISRSRIRKRARAKRDQFDELRDVMDLKKLLGKLPGDGVIVINMTDVRNQGGKINLETETDQKSLQDNIHSMLKQASKFKDFFDKSVDFANQGEMEGRKRIEVKTIDMEVEWDTESGHTKVMRMEESNHRRFNFGGEEAAAQNSTVADRQHRRTIVGPRIGMVQSSRGRTLRPQLQERLAARGIDMARSIHLDSVKRKRKKRISRHKFKKRRKATRAERRRLKR